LLEVIDADVNVDADDSAGMPDTNTRNRNLLEAWAGDKKIALDGELSYRPVRVLYHDQSESGGLERTTAVLLHAGFKTSDNSVTEVSFHIGLTSDF